MIWIDKSVNHKQQQQQKRIKKPNKSKSDQNITQKTSA